MRAITTPNPQSPILHNQCSNDRVGVPFCIDEMFEKSLPDLIRGIRAAGKTYSEEHFISTAVDDIRREVRSNDLDIKAQAVSKLTYVRNTVRNRYSERAEVSSLYRLLLSVSVYVQLCLSLLSCASASVSAQLLGMGYEMSWASFHVIEVMSSSSSLRHKRTGYLAASASFHQDTDVLMLATNLIKKDLASNNFIETALALHGLAQIVTPDLARDVKGREVTECLLPILKIQLSLISSFIPT